jgi:hypothetical protein
MFLLDSLLIDGLKFVFDKLLQVAEAELSDDTVLRERCSTPRCGSSWAS